MPILLMKATSDQILYHVHNSCNTHTVAVVTYDLFSKNICIQLACPCSQLFVHCVDMQVYVYNQSTQAALLLVQPVCCFSLVNHGRFAKFTKLFRYMVCRITYRYAINTYDLFTYQTVYIVAKVSKIINVVSMQQDRILYDNPQSQNLTTSFISSAVVTEQLQIIV